MKKPSLWKLLHRVHEDERGAQTLEVILIIAAIALPILIFLITQWDKIKEWVLKQIDILTRGGGVPLDE
jgi:Flp pilus assembly pilin Flp